MPFGDTAKKIQKVTQTAEKLYERVNYLVEQLQELRDRVESTSEQIDAVDRELAEQRAIVEALAEQQGVDVDAVVAERVGDPEAEADTDEDGATTGTESVETHEADATGETPADGDESTADGTGTTGTDGSATDRDGA